MKLQSAIHITGGVLIILLVAITILGYSIIQDQNQTIETQKSRPHNAL